MTALQMIYVLSVAGALLFFLAGWLARTPRKPAALPASPEASPEAATLEQERQKREVAEASVQRLEFALLDAEKREKEAREQQASDAARADQLRADKEHGVAELERSAQQLARERERAQGLASELEALRKASATARPDKADDEAAHKALQEARDAQGKAEKALEDAVRARDEATRSRGDAVRARDTATRDRDRAMRERDELQKKLAEAIEEGRAALDKARAEAVDAAKSLEAEKRQLEQRLAQSLSEADSAGATRAELAAEREQSARQLARIAELETDAARVEEIRYENEELQVRLETASSYVLKTRKEIAEAKAALQQTQSRLDEALAKAARVQELEQKLATLSQPGESASTSRELDEAHDQLRELRIKLQTVEGKAAEADRLAEENTRLREDVSEIEELREGVLELDNVKGEWKQARVQVDTLTRRIAELEQSRLDQQELDARLQELKAVEQDAARLRDRVRFLEAMVYAAGMDTDEAAPSSRQIDSGTTAGNFEACLETLVRKGPSRSVVLADDGGLMVAGAGDEAPHESMAAVSGLASELANRTTSLLPFSDVQEVHVRDASELVFTCRLFRTEEGNFAVASLGRGSPASDDVDRAVSLVAQVMYSTGPRATADDQADSRQDSDRS